jgi:hypothetical protein
MYVADELRGVGEVMVIAIFPFSYLNISNRGVTTSEMG